MLAIILTARVLGLELGLARAVGAVVFSVVIGLVMHLIFRRDEREERRAAAAMPAEETRPLGQTGLTFAAMVAILVFANWGGGGTGLLAAVHGLKWWLTGLAGAGLGAILVAWFGLPWWKPLRGRGRRRSRPGSAAGRSGRRVHGGVGRVRLGRGHGRGRAGRVVRRQLGLRQADPAAAAGRACWWPGCCWAGRGTRG